jgi:hypothetical protein
MKSGKAQSLFSLTRNFFSTKAELREFSIGPRRWMLKLRRDLLRKLSARLRHQQPSRARPRAEAEGTLGLFPSYEEVSIDEIHGKPTQ